MVWNVFLAFSFSYRSSDCKNYCCALKAYEITRLSKLTSFFFFNKIFNNWPYFSSLVKKKQQQKIKSHTFYISLCPQHSFTSIANLPKFPWAPWEHRPHHRTLYWIWCSAACYRSQYLLIEIEVFSLLDAGPMKTFTEVLQVQVQWLTYN